MYPARFGPMVEWANVTEHWLAVEVLSRSSRFYDREFRRDAYFALAPFMTPQAARPKRSQACCATQLSLVGGNWCDSSRCGDGPNRGSA